MTREELLQLPVTVSVWPQAARAFGIGRSVAMRLAKDGEFPVRVLKVGAQYRVTRADLFRALGVDELAFETPA